jgi:cytochrome P450
MTALVDSDSVVIAPDHVPPDLVVAFDYKKATTGVSDQHAALNELDRQELPPIFYTPAYGGHWVVRSYALVHEVFNDHQNFSTFPSFIPPIPDQLPLIPVQIDPPEHGRYKRILGPLFSPLATRRLEAFIRETAVELLGPIAGRSSCDFVKDYAQCFPQRVFLRFMGMPVDKSGEFVQWAKDFLIGSPQAKKDAGRKITEFIDGFVEEKMAAPGDDWAGTLIKARDTDGRPALTREEIVNICYMLFLAGLDTVTNAHSHMWRYLAENPHLQTALRADPSRIPANVEELLRLFAITNNSRKVRRDMEFHGLRLRAGEPVLLIVSTANRDPDQFPDPHRFDLDRDANVHLSFGAGIHRCIGSNIARAELRISLEEWQSRLPNFRLGEGEISSIGGVTMGLESLPLVWGPSA